MGVAQNVTAARKMEGLSPLETTFTSGAGAEILARDGKVDEGGQHRWCERRAVKDPAARSIRADVPARTTWRHLKISDYEQI